MTYDTRLNRRIAEIIQDNEMAGDHANPAHFYYNTRTPMHKGVIPGNAPYDQMQVFGGVNRLKKANRWSKFVRDLVPESVRNAVEDKAVSMIGKMGGRRVGSTNSPVGGKRPSAWIEHVKAYQRAHGCSYKEAMMGAKASYKK